MSSFTQFEDKDGKVDWTAYHKQQVEDGDECMTCGTYLMNIGIFREPVRSARDCIDCKSIKNDTGEVTHDNYVRCPKCQHRWNPGECDDYSVYESEDEHELWCGECDHKFDVITRIAYSFTSPALIKGEDSD